MTTFNTENMTVDEVMTKLSDIDKKEREATKAAKGTISERTDFLNIFWSSYDLFVLISAIEGGINYWADVTNYKHERTEQYTGEVFVHEGAKPYHAWTGM